MKTFIRITLISFSFIFLANLSFAQGFTISSNNAQGSGSYACYHAGNVIIFPLAQNTLELNIQDNSGQGTIQLPQYLPDMYVNVYFHIPNYPYSDISSFPLLFSSGALNLDFKESGPGCGSPSLSTYSADYDLDLDAIADMIEVPCDPDVDQLYEDHLVIVLTTIDANGDYIHYPMTDYPHNFSCNANNNDAYDGTLIYTAMMCCGNPVTGSNPIPNPDIISHLAGHSSPRSSVADSDIKLVLTPNPFETYVDIISNQQVVDVIVSDVAGNVINRYKNTKRIMLDNVDAGIYIISMFDGKKWTAKRVVKL